MTYQPNEHGRAVKEWELQVYVVSSVFNVPLTLSSKVGNYKFI